MLLGWPCAQSYTQYHFIEDANVPKHATVKDTGVMFGKKGKFSVTSGSSLLLFFILGCHFGRISAEGQ
ncbi:unnamed protein product [Allacma fusca]|uniref:Uncharacterized protein n=1 Tax=Allacma fusca TaxID=39272 RepID=A0A8J2KVM8_9HEXA|nr:unnamed protein product [Allacma fusca]